MTVSLEFLDPDVAEVERTSIEQFLMVAIGTVDRKKLKKWRYIDLLDDATLAKIDRLFTLDYLLGGL